MSALVIAFILFVAAIIIFAIDLMIPTGGILIGVTACLGLAAVVFAFRHSPVTGVWMLIATMGVTPIMLWIFLVVWPKTPLGRRLIVQPESQGSFVWSDASKFSDVNHLVGSVGVAVDELLPSGRVRIGEQSFEAFSETGPIEPGASVRVTRIDVGRLVVTIVREHSPDEPPLSTGTGLDQPASDFNIDSLQ